MVRKLWYARNTQIQLHIQPTSWCGCRKHGKNHEPTARGFLKHEVIPGDIRLERLPEKQESQVPSTREQIDNAWEPKLMLMLSWLFARNRISMHAASFQNGVGESVTSFTILTSSYIQLSTLTVTWCKRREWASQKKHTLFKFIQHLLARIGVC